MALKLNVEKEIEKLLKDGLIRPITSGEKKFRLVIDYRKLNSVTIPDRYPIPEINEVLANLLKKKPVLNHRPKEWFPPDTVEGS